MEHYNRRRFGLELTSIAFSGLFLYGCKSEGTAAPPPTPPLNMPARSAYGPLVSDPNSLLDLPAGFSYRVISALGDAMTDRLPVPNNADGMGCFDLGNGQIALVRNHELTVAEAASVPWSQRIGGPEIVFDRNSANVPLPGGTTTIFYDMRSGRVLEQYRTLGGTIRNCAGGVTPWGSWLTCEEDVTRAAGGLTQDHGWVFEVPANLKQLANPVPLRAMGRFNHEACAVDPTTGIVYLTEDRGDGLFYRFLPNQRGQLAQGGRLQVLGLTSFPTGGDTRNFTQNASPVGQWQNCRWIDLTGVDSANDDLRNRGFALGGALFARGEGVHFGIGELYFACTSGGFAKTGQIMRYRPSRFEGQPAETGEPGQIQNFFESTGPTQAEFPDNLTVSPMAHLLFCEDQGGSSGPVSNAIRGISPRGTLYQFAKVRTTTEPAGICFSPDGSTMFVNLYQPTKTLAITGPWSSFAE